MSAASGRFVRNVRWFLTWWRVDERHLHPGRLSGPLELRQVGLVQPGRLHRLETGRRGCVDPLTEVRELRKQPRNVRTEPERSHSARPGLFTAAETAATSFVSSAQSLVPEATCSGFKVKLNVEASIQ